MIRLAPVVLAVLCLAACGSHPYESGPRGTTSAIVPTSPGQNAESTYVIQAASDGSPHFSVRVLRVPAGTVQLLLNNPSSKPHDLVVEGHGVHAKGSVVTKTNGPDGRSRVTVNLKPGRYVFYSDVGNDRAKGMKGTLVVGALGG